MLKRYGLLLVLLTSHAQAAHFYATGQAGMNFGAQYSDIFLSNDSYDSKVALAGRAEVGYQFDQPWSLGLSLDYLASDIKRANNNSNLAVTTSNGKVRSSIVLLNGYYRLRYNNQFEPYFGLGVGYGKSRIKDLRYANGNTMVESDAGPAAGITVGAAYHVNTLLDVVADYRYLGVGGLFGDSHANVLSAGIRYHFDKQA